MPNATPTCDIGFIGAGVMGKNLMLNLADNGYKVAAFDLDNDKLEALLAQDSLERGDQPPRITACSSYTELLSRLSAPHLIILSVPAGKPVDDVCHKLIDAGIQADDIVVDTGNSLWTDTVAREKAYEGQCIFFSTAVSGGEVGARFGPSLMPSGDPYAWTRIKPVWEAIAAKVDPETGKPIESFEPGKPVTKGEPCAAYIGPGGSGHYVKMVHNGIEYADMQMICETYQVMRDLLDMSPHDIAQVFQQWNQGVLNSYLIDISAQVLATSDPDSGQPLVDIILDKAGQKGTGLWTAVSSLQLGSPAPSIAEAVYARAISSLKTERVKASTILAGPDKPRLTPEQKADTVQALHDALYCAKICVYAQGFHLMKTAADEHGWSLNFSEIARIWRAGCIIRAIFLQSINDAYQRNDALTNLLLDPFFSKQVSIYQQNWRKAVAKATESGIPVAALSSALSYYDAYRTAVLPANLLQGQRDFFGAHMFERTDQARGKKFHVEWNQPGRPIVKMN
ncbi:NADP-dependent phosphogluconate dehydrogenase [Aestuariirhabdus sp. Z084]|uniref:NADP-dependent phosphogluconate dehydrogenase n=1 Tax=Aestuariirhabdus haliotis TaxID=2918751 RepID=UPI00201B43A8|nr:NADP-dependent phosphogluconate dehydrogenase [Aestuariirhabdus haliotis]MCL6416821.1 NADP-dependent phosphogluconate dehydrogenase [Aestuariirhabdus haliotis]MCL6420821.1 NADP-dependent phosphogluconate dehydrogenase [Aestuariirhabdus haliotis]